MSIRILIVEDQPHVRQGLRMFLSLDPDLEIVGDATNGQEAVKMAQTLQPDVILMDILMPKMNGIEATSNLRSLGVVSPIIALSHIQDPNTIIAVMAAGATIYLSKGVQTEQLIAMIKQLYRV